MSKEKSKNNEKAKEMNIKQGDKELAEGFYGNAAKYYEKSDSENKKEK